MRLVSVHTYPIKGCHRVDQDKAAVEPWGLAGDRRWVIIDQDSGRFVTQPDTTGLTRIRPALAPHGLVLRTDGFADLAVAEPRDGEPVDIPLWRERGVSRMAGPEADEWLSEALDRKVRLVWCDDTSRGEPPVATAENGPFPVLIANAASLASLNDLIIESASMEGPVPMTRFRPNLVMDEAPAWAEDAWIGGRVRIGEVTFSVPKACDRCVITTIDQETGEKGHEPLRTLGRHRNVAQKLLFATNLVPENVGTVAIGDPVEPL
jgi:uncharacterized protein